MTGRRYTVAGLAHARSAWFGEVGRWATTGEAPIDFVKCLHAEQLRALVELGTPLSAALVDLGAHGVDRDLLDDLRRAGIAVLAVRGPGTAEPPTAVDVVLDPAFGPGVLASSLDEHAAPIGPEERPAPLAPTATLRHRGRLVVCCGAGGVGTSTVAMAVAQGAAADPRRRRTVALADLARHGEQAVLHDAHDLAPGLPELVEAHRGGRPDPEEVRALLHEVPDRGYDLLLGLRRHRDWTALRPRAVGAAIDGLLSVYGLVVADADADVEGEVETGSIDLEERNALSRAAVARADLVLVVGAPGTKGTHAHARTIALLLDHGLPAGRVQPVVARAARSPTARAASTSALAGLVAAPIASPVFVPEARVEQALRDGRPLPAALARHVSGAVLALLPGLPARPHPDDEPVPVTPGRLGVAS